MSDKELLELAAKAAGWTWWQTKYGYWNVKIPNGGDLPFSVAEMNLADALIDSGFNPLNDSGDALDLAVSLGLMIAWDRWNGNEYICIRHCDLEEVVGIQLDQNRNATVRRAIVMAAAEIGKAMP
jgi:hypothetical protein